MHNSLHIRDLLRKMNADPLCVARRDPHRLVACDPAARPQAGDVVVDNRWALLCDWPDPDVARAIAADLGDFLGHLGVRVAPAIDSRRLEATGDEANRPRPTVVADGGRLSLGPAPAAAGLGPRDFRWDVRADGVNIEAGGVAGLWAAVAWLELEMRTRRGPFLSAGKCERRAAWAHQISQGPWGGNYSVPDFSPEYLSDDAFRLYAHYGVNEMMIYGDLLCYTASRVLPELNHPEAARNLAMLQAAARRAARYGVRFSYVAVGPKLRLDHPVFAAHPDVGGIVVEPEKGVPLRFVCTESEPGREFYREQFGMLFREVPELAGLILIVAQESFYHCKMWWPHQRVTCPRCDGQSTEDVLAHILGDIRGAVTAVNPAAYVAAWPYTTHGWERPDRLEFIRRLPPEVGFMLSIEKDEAVHKDGYIKQVWDYSVDYGGPAEPMRKCSAACRDAKRPLLVKTETGIGLEVIQFPYVPALQRLARKWEGVCGLTPFAVHQSWLFFGMFNSRAEALGLWAAYAPEMPVTEFLRRLAVRDFGPGAAALAVEAWEHMSESMGRLPLLQFNHYYVGPSFLGPCHPLVPEPGMKLDPVFDGFLFYRQEGGETFSAKHIEATRTCLAIDTINPAGGMPQLLPGETRSPAAIIRDEYGLATAAAGRALDCLQRAAPLATTSGDRAHWREEALLAELVYRTNRACWNTARWLMARDAGEREAMAAVARDERQNALDAAALYREAPWLDYPMRIDGRYSPAADMIAAKVRLIDQWLAGAGHAAD